MQEEIWKDVIGFEDHLQVSNLGNVFSKKTNRQLAKTKLKTGYLVINTRTNGRAGKASSLRIHRLVAEAFLGTPSQELLESASKTAYGKVPVNHKDGVKTNNVLSNLEWSSYKLNTQHAFSTGLARGLSGENNPAATLTQEIADEIRKLYIPRDKEFGCRALAAKYGIEHSQVSRIITNKSYISK